MEVRHHAIFVDHDGQALTPRVDSGGVALDSAGYARYLHDMLDAIRSSGRRMLLLFIHGGVVPLEEGLEDSRRMVHDVMADSTQRDVFPIAINWESSLFGSYSEHLFSIRQGRRETRPLAVALTAPFYLLADVGRAVARAPVVWYGQASRFVESDHPSRIQIAERRLRLALDSALVDSTGSHPGAISLSLGEYHATGFQNFIRFATLPFLPFKMVGTFLIDGVGAPGWEVMHRRTKTMYRPSSEWPAVAGTARYIRPAGAVSILLDSLVALTGPVSDDPYRVRLIGHSMGTIVATEAIRTHPGLRISDIVFMGGASTIREFEDGVLPYLETHKETRFYNLSLHPTAERREYYLLHTMPDGSLLEWVDGYLASPETELDRVIGKWDNIIAASRIFPDSVRGQIHLKGFGYRDGVGFGPDGSEPHRHGDFDNPGVPFWRCEFWQPVPTMARCRQPVH